MFSRPLRSLVPPAARFISSSAVRSPLPASFLRGGTSKGIFFKRSDLPWDRADWAPIFLGAMGSPDPVYGRQLNGMGGGISSLSKICVVGEPAQAQRENGADVEYTFCQVGIRDTNLDYSGNCGNLSSMIGVFAIDEGLCIPRILAPQPTSGERGEGEAGMSRAVVRAYNTNTKKYIDMTFPVMCNPAGGYAAALDLPQFTMAGVSGLASRIDLDFVSPAGARTGKLLPTGSPTNELKFSFDGARHSILSSLVDATNPTVFITSLALAYVLGIQNPDDICYTEKHVEDCAETIRQAGAHMMGLDPSAKAQPKIAVLSTPPQPGANNARVKSEAGDVVVHAYSMGTLHKAVPMTLGLCLGVAARIRGTLAHDILSEARTDGNKDYDDLLRIEHPSGVVEVGAVFDADGQVRSAKVVRTGKWLMKGAVWW